MCAPTASDVVAKVATPPLSVPLPSSVAPSRNSTVPPGVPKFDITVAVSVTEALGVLGFGVETSVVVVVALLTVWMVTAETDVMKLALPS